MYPSNLCLLTVLVGLASASLPANWKKCNMVETEARQTCLGSAIKHAITDLMQREVVDGVGKLEPLMVPELYFTQPSGPVRINVTCSGNTYTNVAPVKVHSVKSDLSSHRLKFKIRSLQKVLYKTDFNMQGVILDFPVPGSGTGYIEFENLDWVFDMQFEEISYEGQKVYHVKKCFTDLQPTRMTYDVRGLFKDKAVVESFNKMLNGNWRIVLDAMRATLLEQFGEAFRGMFNKLFHTISVDEIML